MFSQRTHFPSWATKRPSFTYWARGTRPDKGGCEEGGKCLLSRHHPQVQSLNRLLGRAGRFPPPCTKQKKLLLLAQSSEGSGVSSFFELIHPNVPTPSAPYQGPHLCIGNLSHVDTQSLSSSVCIGMIFNSVFPVAS